MQEKVVQKSKFAKEEQCSVRGQNTETPKLLVGIFTCTQNYVPELKQQDESHLCYKHCGTIPFDATAAWQAESLPSMVEQYPGS